MRPTSVLSASLLALVALGPGPASADTLDARRFKLSERAHVIDMKVDRGFATMVVQRTVTNLGPISD